MGAADVKKLAERAGSSQEAKMRELEEPLAMRDQLEKFIEGGFHYGFRRFRGGITKNSSSCERERAESLI